MLETNGTSESFFYRGNCYYSLKEFSSAYTDYTKALEQEPDNYDIYYNRGYESFKLKDYNGAITDWKRAVELNPEYRSELELKIKIAEEESLKKKKKSKLMLPGKFKSTTQFYMLFGFLILTVVLVGLYIGFLK